jgi:hypothetical protein
MKGDYEMESIEDDEILEELHKSGEKEDFNSIINKKKINKFEMDEAFLGEV